MSALLMYAAATTFLVVTFAAAIAADVKVSTADAAAGAPETSLLCISECDTCPTVCAPPPPSSSQTYTKNQPPPAPAPQHKKKSPPSPPPPPYIVVTSAPPPPSGGQSGGLSYPYYYFYTSSAPSLVSQALPYLTVVFAATTLLLSMMP